MTTFAGLGNAASWTPDSKTLYITDSAALNNLPANMAAGITGHTDTLYVYNVQHRLDHLPAAMLGGRRRRPSMPQPLSTSNGAQSLAITIPSVGAYLSGDSDRGPHVVPVGYRGRLSAA